MEAVEFHSILREWISYHTEHHLQPKGHIDVVFFFELQPKIKYKQKMKLR